MLMSLALILAGTALWAQQVDIHGTVLDDLGEGLPECDGLLVLNLPPVKPDCLVPVIEMYLK